MYTKHEKTACHLESIPPGSGIDAYKRNRERVAVLPSVSLESLVIDSSVSSPNIHTYPSLIQTPLNIQVENVSFLTPK